MPASGVDVENPPHEQFPCGPSSAGVFELLEKKMIILSNSNAKIMLVVN